jgi:hypothetical protein
MATASLAPELTLCCLDGDPFFAALLDDVAFGDFMASPHHRMLLPRPVRSIVRYTAAAKRCCNALQKSGEKWKVFAE